MKKKLILVYLIFLCTTAIGQDYNLAGQRADMLLNEFIRITNIPGLSAAISIEDKIVYANSFGLSDIDNNKSVSDSTKYRIGSVTKLFTAGATVKLIELGIIDGNSAISKYINNLPAEYQNITISQLASHTAGIRHYSRDEIMSTNITEYSDLEDGLNKFINDSLLFKPGEKYKYSSYGYVLLGSVLENACNKNFNEIINEYVLLPSGMTNTTPEFADELNINTSRFYFSSKENGFTLAKGENSSYKWPAGGYLSTAKDLAKFGSELISGKITGIKMLSLLFDSQKTNDGVEINCGYGFRIGTDNRGRKIIHHGGESAGARAFVLIYPEQKLTIALVANVFRAPLFEGEAETIAGYFLNDYNSEESFLKGTIKFSTTNNEKPVDGEIKFDEKLITGMTKADIPIIDIVQDGNKIRLIALSQSGIINFWISKENDNYSGKWGYDKETSELKF